MAGAQTHAPADEHLTVRRGCGLIDRSERGKLALTGTGAAEFLTGQVTNDVLALEPGHGLYAAFLTHKGKMLGDMRVLAVGAGAGGPAGELLLDTERASLQALFDMIRRFKVGYDVELHKRTLERGLISLLGAASEAVAGVAGLDEAEHSHIGVEIDSIPALAIRTHAGVDLLCDAGDTQALIAALCARGAQEVSLQAAECLRIEHGRPRFGVDLDESVIPQEAGLNERAVSFTKGCYVGQETVARLHYKGRPNRHLRGLLLSAPAPAGAEVQLGERTVGNLASTALSPGLGPIALALLRREAEPGAEVGVGPERVPARVVELPFAGGPLA